MPLWHEMKNCYLHIFETEIRLYSHFIVVHEDSQTFWFVFDVGFLFCLFIFFIYYIFDDAWCAFKFFLFSYINRIDILKLFSFLSYYFKKYIFL